MAPDFKPETSFEGWLKAKIENLEDALAEFKDESCKKWENHLHHHEILEGRILKWGIILSSLTAFVGWVVGKQFF